MLELQFIREHPQIVRDTLRKKRLVGVDVDRVLELDEKWRARLAELEQLRSQHNAVSSQLGRRKRAGKDTSEQLSQLRAASLRLTELEERVRELRRRLERELLRIPNVPDESVPTGASDDDNVVVREEGERPEFGFEPQPHWELGERLGLLEPERGARMSGSSFPVYRGAGARLERALRCFLVDLQLDRHGYTEVALPLLVRPEAAVATANLPRFADDMFSVDGSGLYLVPSAEVALTNLHREEVLPPGALSMSYVAANPCFRNDTHSQGRDSRGLQRLRQFTEVGLIKIVEPEASLDALEQVTNETGEGLRLLQLPFRVVLLYTGELTFASAKAYRLDVWMPGLVRYLAVSTCKNYRDFQARRAGIRYRPAQGAPPRYVHTVNADLTVSRILAAVLENYQQRDGTVMVPEVLREYMGAEGVIKTPSGTISV